MQPRGGRCLSGVAVWPRLCCWTTIAAQDSLCLGRLQSSGEGEVRVWARLADGSGGQRVRPRGELALTRRRGEEARGLGAWWLAMLITRDDSAARLGFARLSVVCHSLLQRKTLQIT